MCRRRTAVEMYSGAGTLTRPFVDDGWNVVRVDCFRNRRRKPTVLADCRQLPLRGPIDFLWASPPCTEFSDANPYVGTRRPSLEHIFAVLSAVVALQPRFWILENVRGAIPFLGIPVQKIGPFCLWGYFPPIRVSPEMQTYRKHGRASGRAKIPPALALAVHRAIETFWDARSILDLRTIRVHRHVRDLTLRQNQLFDVGR